MLDIPFFVCTRVLHWRTSTNGNEQILCQQMRVVFSTNAFLFSNQAKLQPSDAITVYYETTAGLSKVIREFGEFIYSTTKQPLRPFPVKPGAETVISEKTKVRFGGKRRGCSLKCGTLNVKECACEWRPHSFVFPPPCFWSKLDNMTRPKIHPPTSTCGV